MSDATGVGKFEGIADAAFRNFELYLMVMTAFVLGGIMGSVLAAGAGIAVALWATAIGAVAVAVGIMAADLLVDTPRRFRDTDT